MHVDWLKAISEMEAKPQVGGLHGGFKSSQKENQGR